MICCNHITSGVLGSGQVPASLPGSLLQRRQREMRAVGAAHIGPSLLGGGSGEARGEVTYLNCGTPSLIVFELFFPLRPEFLISPYKLLLSGGYNKTLSEVRMRLENRQTAIDR